MDELIEQHLWLIKSAIEPTESQKEGAQRSHTYLRELLKSGNIGSRITGSFLSGSYSRDTAIRPIDDVDIIFTIDPTYWNINVFSAADLFRQTQQGQNQNNRTLLSRLLEPYQSPYPRPADVLESFANAIRYRYPLSSVFNQTRSVRLSLNHLDIDVVPAIPLDQSSTYILIPDKTKDEWIKSAPKLHAERATQVNALRGGRFKPLVKLLKAWNGNIASTAKFKSFCIETMATRIFSELDFQSLSNGLLYFWDFCASLGGRQQTYIWKSNYGISSPLLFPSFIVPDASGLGTNVASDVEFERKMRFIEHAARSRDRLISARGATNQSIAINYLRDAMYLGS